MPFEIPPAPSAASAAVRESPCLFESSGLGS